MQESILFYIFMNIEVIPVVPYAEFHFHFYTVHQINELIITYCPRVP